MIGPGKGICPSLGQLQPFSEINLELEEKGSFFLEVLCEWGLPAAIFFHEGVHEEHLSPIKPEARSIPGLPSYVIQ